ncbi:MAG TPA: hypothetical protein VFV40_09865 [Nocardioides sp.]|nr:hypothetical protein [Nocardioides sp.]
MAKDEYDFARLHLLRALMDKVADERYPSATMMDTIEELMIPQELPVYAQLLVEHIESERFPSIDMINRLRNLQP